MKDSRTVNEVTPHTHTHVTPHTQATPHTHTHVTPHGEVTPHDVPLLHPSQCSGSKELYMKRLLSCRHATSCKRYEPPKYRITQPQNKCYSSVSVTRGPGYKFTIKIKVVRGKQKLFVVLSNEYSTHHDEFNYVHSNTTLSGAIAFVDGDYSDFSY